MAKQKVTRKLTAILAADVVGYSRLIRADEEGTLAALKLHLADLIDPKITQHHGRIVKLMGDGILAEFPSVVDAVRAAAEMQRAMGDRNAGVSDECRIDFRMGINLGDVVIDGDDIHGDGVNVAARLGASPSRAAFAYRPPSTTRFATGRIWNSPTWASARSRTSTGRSGCGAGRWKAGRPRVPRPGASRQTVDRGAAVRQHVE